MEPYTAQAISNIIGGLTAPQATVLISVIVFTIVIIKIQHKALKVRKIRNRHQY